MARLNDPAPDPTAFDALKRRFTRQNRDLARTNSAQSLRIRNLETEISRLLSENIALREAAIAAQKEAERWRREKGLGGEVLAMKDRLEAKLREVNDLVCELGGLPEQASRRKSREKRRDSVIPSDKLGRSPDQKDWRNRQTIAGVLGASTEQEGRLPPIVEDKLYPRRTLEPLDIQRLQDEPVQHENESPEIGPPPVSHFDAAERGSWGNTESPASQEATVLEEDMAQLPSVEIRRKRRTSSLLQDMTQSESESDAQDSRPALFRSGAKRKLDVSELEEPHQDVKEHDDFVFQRRPALKPAGRQSGRFSVGRGERQDEIIIPTTAPSPQREEQKERRVLAPKSTNPPSKRMVNVDRKDLKPDIKDQDRNRVAVVRNISNVTQPSKPRRQQPEAPPEPEPTHRPQPADPQENNDLPPKTPFAPEDILSPISTEPSTKNASKHPTQEAAIINSVEDVLNGSIGRGSRRARAAVSYAEPKLNSKMRRPGKEMVSAVDGIERKVREGSVGTEFRRSQSEVAEPVVKIEDESLEFLVGPSRDKFKRLPLAEVRFKKEEPASPLSDKKQNPDEDRERAARRHERTTSVPDGGGIEALEKDVRRMSIFDPPSSSPADPKPGIPQSASAPAATTATKRKPQTTTSASSRRHSIVPSSQPPPSNMLGNRSTNTQRPSSAASNHSIDAKRNGVDLKRATSVAAMRDVAGVENRDEVAKARSDRIASRRRSMMI